MFADIEGSTAMIGLADAERALELIDPVIRVMVETAERHNGVVGHRGDGIIATFGAPSICEDHALRACFAALTIQESLATLYAGIKVRIGMHSGEVVVSSLKVGGSHIPHVTGVAVHVAARLEQTAEAGMICLSSSAHDLVRPYVRTQALPPIMVKGLDHGLTRVALLGLQPSTDRWQARRAGGLRPMIDRTAERAKLIRQLDASPTVGVRAVQVGGPAGIGKSRLLHEVVEAAEARGWTVVRFSGDPHRTHVPFNAILVWLRAIMGLRADDTATEARKRIADVVGALTNDASHAADTLERLLGVGVEARSTPTPSLKDADLRRIEQLTTTVLVSRVGDGSILISCDDADQFDAASSELLHALVDRLHGRNVLVVATHRSRFRLGISERASMITLEPLSREDTIRLLVSIDGSFAFRPQAMASVAENASGNPLFVEEVAALMGASGALASAGDMGLDQQVPARVQSLITDRLAQLPPDQRQLLQLCAVFGLDIPVDGLARLLGMTPLEVSRRLTRLKTSQLLVETRRYPDAQFSFRQRLVRDVAYRTLLAARRREIHARIVRNLEEDKEREGGSSGRIDDLVLHALAAELWEPAIAYLRQAAADAMRKFAYSTAIAHLKRALDASRKLPPDDAHDPLRLGIMLELRSLLTALGHYPEMSLLLDDARALAERLGDRRALVQILFHRVHVHNILGELRQGVSLARVAVEMARHLGDPERIVSAQHFLGQALFNTGELHEASSVLAEACLSLTGPQQEAGVTGSPAAQTCGTRCLALSFLGRFEEAEGVVADGFGFTGQNGRPYDLAFLWSTRAFMFNLQRKPDRAAEAALKGMRIAEQAGLEQLLLPLRVGLGHAQLLSGHFTDAFHSFMESLATARGRSRLMMQIWAGNGLALAANEMGHTKLAFDTASEALSVAQQSGFRAFEAISHRALGLVLLSRFGGTKAGLASLRDALAVASSIGMKPEIELAEGMIARCTRTQVKQREHSWHSA